MSPAHALLPPEPPNRVTPPALVVSVCKAHRMTGCAACDGIPGAHDVRPGCLHCLRPAIECRGHSAAPALFPGPLANLLAEESPVQPCTSHLLPSLGCVRCFAEALDTTVHLGQVHDTLQAQVSRLAGTQDELLAAQGEVRRLASALAESEARRAELGAQLLCTTREFLAYRKAVKP